MSLRFRCDIYRNDRVHIGQPHLKKSGRQDCNYDGYGPFPRNVALGLGFLKAGLTPV